MIKRRPCKTCPFVKSTPNIGRIDWIEDIVRWVMSGGKRLDHSCHVTDPKADGFVGGKPQPCWGFIAMLKKSGNKKSLGCDAQDALDQGKWDWREVSMKGIFNSPSDCIMHHAKGNLREEENEER